MWPHFGTRTHTTHLLWSRNTPFKARVPVEGTSLVLYGVGMGAGGAGDGAGADAPTGAAPTSGEGPTTSQLTLWPCIIFFTASGAWGTHHQGKLVERRGIKRCVPHSMAITIVSQSTQLMEALTYVLINVLLLDHESLARVGHDEAR